MRPLKRPWPNASPAPGRSIRGVHGYLFAPELLTVVSSFQPPTLAIDRPGAGPVRVEVNVIPGQRIVLESTIDFQSRQPLVTNWLTTNRWSNPAQTAADEKRFYRGRIQ